MSVKQSSSNTHKAKKPQISSDPLCHIRIAQHTRDTRVEWENKLVCRLLCFILCSYIHSLSTDFSFHFILLLLLFLFCLFVSYHPFTATYTTTSQSLTSNIKDPVSHAFLYDSFFSVWLIRLNLFQLDFSSNSTFEPITRYAL